MGYEPRRIFITPDGQRAFVTHPGVHVTLFALPTQSPLPRIRLGPCVDEIAFSPDSTTGYATVGCASPRIQSFSVATGALERVINVPVPAASMFRQDTDVSGFPIVVSPDGRSVYVATANYDTVSGQSESVLTPVDPRDGGGLLLSSR